MLNRRVYLAAPTADHPYRVFVVIDGPGLRIKLAGDVSPDPVTGRVTSVFDGLPQVPFTRFTRSVPGRRRAVLVNDVACGLQRTDTRLTPWSGGAGRHAHLNVPDEIRRRTARRAPTPSRSLRR